MKNERQVITRREFLKSTAVGTAGIALLGTSGLALEAQETGRAAAASSVVLVRDPLVFTSDNTLDQAVVDTMLDQAVKEVFETATPDEAWKRVAGPADVVGIKSNGWRMLPTPREVELTVSERLIGAGVKEDNIAVEDQGALENDVFKRSTALVNLCTLRTHFWSGTGGCIKNYIMFVKKPWTYHDDQCANLGAIWNLPHVKGKTRLNVLCALSPLFWGRGPHHFDTRYVWNYSGLILGTDPVAVDSVGVRLLQAKRLAYFGEDRPLDTTPKHVIAADERHKLGTSDPARIRLVKLGWEEDSLI
jgi:hypothetical protein